MECSVYGVLHSWTQRHGTWQKWNFYYWKQLPHDNEQHVVCITQGMDGYGYRTLPTISEVESFLLMSLVLNRMRMSGWQCVRMTMCQDTNVSGYQCVRIPSSILSSYNYQHCQSTPIVHAVVVHTHTHTHTLSLTHTHTHTHTHQSEQLEGLCGSNININVEIDFNYSNNKSDQLRV